MFDCIHIWVTQDILYIVEFVAIFCFSVAFSVYGNYDAFDDNCLKTTNIRCGQWKYHTWFTWFYYIYVYIIVSFATSLFFYTLISAIRYFNYPTKVMKEFGKQIYGKNVKDFVLW